MNEETERRVKKLLQPIAFAQNPWYHAQVSVFQAWLDGAEMAMQDEGVSNSTIQRILNRMVYGMPVPFDAQGKMTMIEKETLERLMMNQTPRPSEWPDVQGT